MDLSIVFPAYNEEGNLPPAVTSAMAAIGAKTGEVIVVNDGSRDRTGQVAEELARTFPDRVRVIHHPKNLGYATALRNGFEAAKGDWIFYSDSDNQFDMREIERVWALRNEADIVAGYRIDRKDPPARIFAAGVYNRIVRFLFGIPVRDVDCAFKLFRKSVFDRVKIRSKGFLVDAEILSKSVRYGLVIREVGVTHLARTQGASTVRFRHVAQTLRGLVWLLWEVRR